MKRGRKLVLRSPKPHHGEGEKLSKSSEKSTAERARNGIHWNSQGKLEDSEPTSDQSIQMIKSTEEHQTFRLLESSAGEKKT